MKLFNKLTLLCLIIMGTEAMKNISSLELVKNMKIGWNLGNTLDAQCIDSLNYSKDQTASETCWCNVKTTKALYTKLSSLGFNTFRIPTTWSGHFGSGPQYKINAIWMKRVHEVVDYALSTGGYAILNIHHETWNYAFSNNLSNAKTILVAIWKQIADEFKNYDEHLIFEGMNEPRKVGSSVEWTGGDNEGWSFVNEMNGLFVKTIRATGGNNALRHLMIPTYAASINDNATSHFKLPSNDNKLIVSLHSYNPYNFALNTGNGAVNKFSDTSEVDWIISNIKNTFINKNIPVIIGELGAINRNNEAERAKWGKYYISKAKSIGVPCILWDNGVFSGSGETFGLINRSSLQVTFPTLVNNLISAAGANSKTNSSSSKNNAVSNKKTNSNAAKTKVTTVNKTNAKANVKTTTKSNTTASTKSSTNYLSCKSNDWNCKQKMSDQCYKDASTCWTSGKSGSECNKINDQCSKIWT
jgi:endoglucanase